jgi:hypothetical protein
VAARKSFLLRVDAAMLEAMQRWANDDLRSLNGQIEYVLRDALRRVGRAAAANPLSNVPPSNVPPSNVPPSDDPQKDET